MSLSGFRAAAHKKVVLSMCNAFSSNRHEQQLLTKVILKKQKKNHTGAAVTNFQWNKTTATECGGHSMIKTKFVGQRG